MTPPAAAFTLLLLAAASLAQAAPDAAADADAKPRKGLLAPKVHLTVDHSTASLMDKATADKLWKQHLGARVAKLYPVPKWGFISQVEGGFDASKTCVLTARAMMVPRRGKNLIFEPTKSATTFATQAGATVEQCRELARTKLDEAIVSVRSSLLKD